MRAIFLAEVRRGGVLLLFGISLGALVVLLRGLFGAYPPLVSASMMSDRAVFGYVKAAAFLIAVIGGARVVASEQERGTLPVLLGLPLSRRRIWLAKVAAGIFLAGLPSALLAALSVAALAEPARASEFWLGMLMLALPWLVAFLAAVFWSTLLDRTISAAMAAVISSSALLWLILPMSRRWGAALFGTWGTDLTLWAMATAPGLLLGSLVAFSRGELLRSRRKWLLGAGVLVASTAAVVLLIVGGVRWTTRYQRARGPQRIVPLSLSANGTVATLETMQVRDRSEMTPTGRRIRRPNVRIRDATRHLVVTDLTTGRDLIVRRGEGVAAVSPDRRLAALVPEPFALTYRAKGSWPYTCQVEIRDLTTGRLLYRGWPEEFREYRNIGEAHNRIASVEWSPDGDWVAMQGRDWSRLDELLLMRPDGSDPSAIPLLPHLDWGRRRTQRRWDWDPSGNGIYALTLQERAPRDARLTGRRLLVHHRLPGGRATSLWDPFSAVEIPAPYDWLTAYLSVSPDSRWIAVGLAAVPCEPTQQGNRRPVDYGKALAFVFLVASDGTRSLRISETSLDHGFRSLDFVWSKESKRLYYLTRSQGWDSELRVWREGDAGSAVLTLPGPQGGVRAIALLPQSGHLLIWTDRDAFLADERDQVRPFPNERVRSHLRARRLDLLGLDNQGRAIVSDGLEAATTLAALDLDTGELKRIYP